MRHSASSSELRQASTTQVRPGPISVRIHLQLVAEVVDDVAGGGQVHDLDLREQDRVGVALDVANLQVAGEPRNVVVAQFARRRLEQGSFIPYGDYVFKPVTNGYSGFGSNGGGCSFMTVATAVAVGFLAGVLGGGAAERAIIASGCVLCSPCPHLPSSRSVFIPSWALSLSLTDYSKYTRVTSFGCRGSRKPRNTVTV